MAENFADEQTNVPVKNYLLWDCHVHVFGPYNLFPLAPERPYTPEEAVLEHLKGHLADLRIGRVILVQPSPFAWDNSCLLAALKGLGAMSRAVMALGAASLAKCDLSVLWDLGVRGLRVNPGGKLSKLSTDIAKELIALACQLQSKGWHLEINATLPVMAEVLDLLKEFSLSVVAGHLVGLRPGQNLNDKELRPIYAALEASRLWIKISGWDRYGPGIGPEAWAGLLPRLMQKNEQAFVWGSDWPHTPLHKGVSGTGNPVMPFRQVDDLAALRWLEQNLSPEICRKIFLENPARLYG